MIDDPETHLEGSHEGLFIVCHRRECCVRDERYNDSVQPFRIELPFQCLPETAVMIRARHLATHTEDEMRCFYVQTYVEEVGHFMMCRIHENNSKYIVSAGFDKPCITVDPW